MRIKVAKEYIRRREELFPILSHIIRSIEWRRHLMISMLEGLAGRKVVSVVVLHDYLQLVFEGDNILTINNACELMNEGKRESNLQKLEGQALESVSRRQSKIILTFSQGDEVMIDLSDEAYSSPEAMILNQPGRSPIVW